MSFPRYPAYKPSGVEWLGEVPEHWNLCRTDAVIGSCRSTINADALAHRPVFHYSIPVVQETGDGQLEDGSDIDSGKLVVTEPQVLVSKLNPRKGTVCIAHPHDVLTVCSSEFVPLLPRSEDIRFLWYIVQSENYRTRLESLVESATKSHQRAAPSDIYRLMWSFPPRMEQTTIATFLDRETAKIDALIAEQQRLIQLLQEKRQAVISHAVTKGLNPDAPMKDSGVEWLGEVPEHWTVTQLRHFTRSLPGFAFSSEGFIQDESKWKLLRGVNVGVSCIRWDDTVYWDRQVDDCLDQFVLSPGDLVVGLDRPMIKEGLRVARITQEDCPCILLQRVAAVKGSKNLSTDYLFFLLSSPYFLAHFEPETTGVSVPHISTGQIDSFVVPIPPPQEQAEVVAFLLAELMAIQRLTEESSRSISLLQERRSALISAAVTGQIDVRGLVPETSAA